MDPFEKRIAELLMDKEDTTMGILAQNWSQDAASLESVSKAGTLTYELLKFSIYGGTLAVKNSDTQNIPLVQKTVPFMSTESFCPFRRSLWTYLMSKATPLLAGLVAYADTNCNIDIIYNNNPDWIHTLWLNMLTDSEVTPLCYSDIPGKQKNLVYVSWW